MSVDVQIYGDPQRGQWIEVVRPWGMRTHGIHADVWRELVYEIVLEDFFLSEQPLSMLLESPQTWSIHSYIECRHQVLNSHGRRYYWITDVPINAHTARVVVESEDFRRGLLWVITCASNAVPEDTVRCYMQVLRPPYHPGRCKTGFNAVFHDPDDRVLTYWNPIDGVLRAHARILERARALGISVGRDS